MAKKKAARPPRASGNPKKAAPKKAPGKQASESSRSKGAAKGTSKGRTIKAPAAPALMSSPEAGAPLAQDQAIGEKLRLYPKATTQEIAAMFELDGVRVDPEAIETARRRIR